MVVNFTGYRLKRRILHLFHCQLCKNSPLDDSLENHSHCHTKAVFLEDLLGQSNLQKLLQPVRYHCQNFPTSTVLFEDPFADSKSPEQYLLRARSPINGMLGVSSLLVSKSKLKSVLNS